jgi:hypothetical protein
MSGGREPEMELEVMVECRRNIELEPKKNAD